MFLAFDKALEGGFQIDLMIFANLFKSFIELVGAGLAAPNVECGEEGSPCSRVLGEKGFHGKFRGHLSWHSLTMTENPFGERGELRLSKGEDL
jgi:hypothetical protein